MSRQAGSTGAEPPIQNRAETQVQLIPSTHNCADQKPDDTLCISTCTDVKARETFGMSRDPGLTGIVFGKRSHILKTKTDFHFLT